MYRCIFGPRLVHCGCTKLSPWRPDSLIFVARGPMLARWGHPGGPWQQEQGYAGGRNRTFIDFRPPASPQTFCVSAPWRLVPLASSDLVGVSESLIFCSVVFRPIGSASSSRPQCSIDQKAHQTYSSTSPGSLLC